MLVVVVVGYYGVVVVAVTADVRVAILIVHRISILKCIPGGGYCGASGGCGVVVVVVVSAKWW